MRALILCHNRLLGHDLSFHWSGKLFIRIQEKYFPNITFAYDTVDLAALCTDGEYPDLSNQQTFENNNQSSDFTTNHKHKYNIVFMSDFNKRWLPEVFSKSSGILLHTILDKTMNLVADDGILYVSKLTEPLSVVIRENFLFIEHIEHGNFDENDHSDSYLFSHESYKLSLIKQRRSRKKTKPKPSLALNDSGVQLNADGVLGVVTHGSTQHLPMSNSRVNSSGKPSDHKDSSLVVSDSIKELDYVDLDAGLLPVERPKTVKRTMQYSKPISRTTAIGLGASKFQAGLNYEPSSASKLSSTDGVHTADIKIVDEREQVYSLPLHPRDTVSTVKNMLNQMTGRSPDISLFTLNTTEELTDKTRDILKDVKFTLDPIHRGSENPRLSIETPVQGKTSSAHRNKKVGFVLAAVTIALAGIGRFIRKPDETQARSGIAFQRDHLTKTSALDRRDALAILRASGGRVQARILLMSRAEVMDYLLALKGFERKKGSVKNEHLCPDEDVNTKLRRLVRRSSAMTREEWVALFPCILEITITDPYRQGRRRRTDVTCEMITREPWLALGRLPQETTK